MYQNNKYEMGTSVPWYKKPFVAPEKINKKVGFFMWLIILLGYFVFILNWSLAGSVNDAIIFHYFGANKPATIVNQAINWGITAGRALGSLAIAWVIIKFTHKWSVLFALFLSFFAIPASYMPDYGSYTFFRFLFGVGSTTLIIVIQPVIAQYFSAKGKAIISTITPVAYPIAVIFSQAMPLSGEAKLWFEANWQAFFTAFSCLLVVLAIFYFVIAQRFDLLKKPEATTQNLDQEAQEFVTAKSKYLKIISKKENWIWTAYYTAWLVAVVIPLVTIKKQLPNLITFHYGNDPAWLVNQANAASHILIWLILFHVPIFIVPFTIGLWNRFNLRRKPYIIGITAAGIALFAFSVLTYVFGIATSKNQNNLLWLFYIFAFFSGLFLWGIQGVFLNNPYEQERKLSHQEVSYKFSWIWGSGYLGFTIVLIIVSLLADIKVDGLPTGSVAWIIVILMVMIVAPISWMFMKETKPNAPYLPGKNSDWKIKK